jgi:hypothetical protein
MCSLANLAPREGSEVRCPGRQEVIAAPAPSIFRLTPARFFSSSGFRSILSYTIPCSGNRVLICLNGAVHIGKSMADATAFAASGENPVGSVRETSGLQLSRLFREYRRVYNRPQKTGHFRLVIKVSPDTRRLNS